MATWQEHNIAGEKDPALLSWEHSPKPPLSLSVERQSQWLHIKYNLGRLQPHCWYWDLSLLRRCRHAIFPHLQPGNPFPQLEFHNVNFSHKVNLSNQKFPRIYFRSILKLCSQLTLFSGQFLAPGFQLWCNNVNEPKSRRTGVRESSKGGDVPLLCKCKHCLLGVRPIVKIQTRENFNCLVGSICQGMRKLQRANSKLTCSHHIRYCISFQTAQTTKDSQKALKMSIWQKLFLQDSACHTEISAVLGRAVARPLLEKTFHMKIQSR